MAAPADDTTRTDRVAIVTGGSRGLGREVTRTLAGRGFAVVVYYARDQCAADATVEEVLAANGTALTVRGDVADELDVERLFAETIKAFGGVDVVVHAVGQISLGPAADGDLDTFDALLPTSVRGTFVVNRQAARELRDGGAIVNISGSVDGLARPTRAAYAAELRCSGGDHTSDRPRAPGTRHHRQRRRARAGASGDRRRNRQVVAFLVSEAGHGVNGQVIRFNGGLE